MDTRLFINGYEDGKWGWVIREISGGAVLAEYDGFTDRLDAISGFRELAAALGAPVEVVDQIALYRIENASAVRP